MSTLFKALGMSIVLGTIFLAACGPVDPNARARHNAKLQEQAENQDHQIVKLFTQDGCTVYRFRDDGYRHYFTNCTGSTITEQSSGKSHYSEEIPTAVN